MKRILTVILTLTVLVGALGIMPVSATESADNVWDGETVAATFAGGSGTEADPYQISNGAELALLADLVTNQKDGNYNRAHYVLTADIVLNDMPEVSTWYDGWRNDAEDAYVPQNMFTPIGTWDTATSSFGGTFDGQDHTISGAYFYSKSGDNHGLFGAVQGGAVIKNFALVNSLFGNEGGNIAAIAGTTDRSNGDDILIENIYVEAYVYSGGNTAGGIMGTLSNSQDGYNAGVVTLSRVTFNGLVEGKNHVAGLIADSRSVVFDIDDCLVNVKSIKATGGEYAAGFVTRSNNTLDKVAKYEQVVTNSIVVGAQGAISASGEKHRAFIATVGVKSGTKNDAKSKNPPLAEYCYNAVPGLATMRYADTTDDAPSADVMLTELYGIYEGDTDINWEELTAWARPDIDIARPSGIAERFEINRYRALEKGSGTEADPYLIETAEELETFSFLSQTDTFEGKFIKLGADIALEGENNHSPIGSWDVGFGGTFDGNGHTVSGVHIKNSGDGSGFFGAIQGGAIIKNFALVDAYVESTGKGCVGALVGQTNRGKSADITIDNVYVSAEVVVKGGEVAGIIGNISDNKGDYVAGTVNITNTVFSGSVTASGKYCAGIVGNSRSVPVILTNCANYATVTTTVEYAAGLLVSGVVEKKPTGAYTITNCISAGAVNVKEGSELSCAIACTETTSESARTIINTYYVTGIADDNKANNLGEGATADIKYLENKAALMGENALDLEGWTKRAYDVLVPTTMADFAPEKQEITFVVKWTNHDGSLIYEEEYKSGQLLEYKGELPTKDSDENYNYVFNAWKLGDEYVTLTQYELTGDITLTATFIREKKTAEPDNGSNNENEPEDTDEPEVDTEVETESETESETSAVTEPSEVKEKSFFGKIFDAIFNFFKGMIDAIFGKKD